MSDDHLKQDHETTLLHTNNATGNRREDIGSIPEIAGTDHGKAHQETSTQLGYTDFERLFRAEESYEQPTTTRRELWSYYLYYNGTILHQLLTHDIELI